MKSKLLDTTFDLSEIGQIAAAFGPWIKPPALFTFSGPLGAGKTTLIAALLKAHFDIDDCQSPTFTMVHHYPGVAHFDLYRLTDPAEFYKMGFDEAFDEVALMEWPERLEGSLKTPHYRIELAPVGETTRRIRVDAPA